MNHDTSEVMFEYMGSDRRVPQNVTHVQFHPSVIKVEDYAFHERTELREVILNDGLTEIGFRAFYYCTSLQSINIPSTVIKIGNRAFHGCHSLNAIVLNEGLTSIDSSAFQYCRALRSIELPSTVIEIGSFAFDNCTNLREVLLKEGIEKVKERAFQNCRSLESITIPSTASEINKFAFLDCGSLQEVVIQNEEVQISFLGCPSLERFKFPRLSTRLDNVIQAGQRGIEAKMDDVPAVEWRDRELIIPSIRRVIGSPFGGVESTQLDKEKLDKIVRLVRYYEIKEATTLFELALWKARIDQAVDDDEPANRDARRIEVPGPVKDAILQYL